MSNNTKLSRSITSSHLKCKNSLIKGIHKIFSALSWRSANLECLLLPSFSQFHNKPWLLLYFLVQDTTFPTAKTRTSSHHLQVPPRIPLRHSTPIFYPCFQSYFPWCTMCAVTRIHRHFLGTISLLRDVVHRCNRCPPWISKFTALSRHLTRCISAPSAQHWQNYRDSNNKSPGRSWYLDCFWHRMHDCRDLQLERNPPLFDRNARDSRDNQRIWDWHSRLYYSIP